MLKQFIVEKSSGRNSHYLPLCSYWKCFKHHDHMIDLRAKVAGTTRSKRKNDTFSYMLKPTNGPHLCRKYFIIEPKMRHVWFSCHSAVGLPLLVHLCIKVQSFPFPPVIYWRALLSFSCSDASWELLWCSLTGNTLICWRAPAAFFYEVADSSSIAQ